MAWKDVPEIRDLEPYCKKFNYEYIVTFAVHQGHEKYTVTTYGKNKKLCLAAAVAGDLLREIVQAGQWPKWPEEMPLFADVEPTKKDGDRPDKKTD